MKKILLLVVFLVLLFGGVVALKLRGRSAQGASPQGTYRLPTQELSMPTDAVTPESEGTMKKEEGTTAQSMNLEIMEPQDKATVTATSITVKGKTAPSATVFVNEMEVKADAQGMFSTPVTLEEGENYIIVVANDADGNSAEKELMITVQSS